jgi:hypothetical protein
MSFLVTISYNHAKTNTIRKTIDIPTNVKNNPRAILLKFIIIIYHDFFSIYYKYIYRITVFFIE